jgi:hypothetical protein
MRDSVKLEILIAKIQKSLAPNATVEHNVQLPTRDGLRTRQVDVLVRDNIGRYEFLIVIDCKDHSRKLDVRGVGEFYDLVTDVGAHRGVLVCPKGFTSGALSRAKELQIDLYSPVDTDPHKWKVKATVPCIVDYRSAAISFSLSVSSPHPWVLPQDFLNSSMIYNDKDEPLGTIVETGFNNWFEGKYPTEPGVHEDQPIFGSEDTFTNVNPKSTEKGPITLSANVHVTQRFYFGHAEIPKISGFFDHHSGGVITNAFEVFVNHDEVEESWQIIDKIEDAPVRPLFISTGLVAYKLE